MFNEKQLLLKEIEERRKEMVELGLSRSFADEHVVRLSDQLDQLLNRYHYIGHKHASSSS